MWSVARACAVPPSTSNHTLNSKFIAAPGSPVTPQRRRSTGAGLSKALNPERGAAARGASVPSLSSEGDADSGAGGQAAEAGPGAAGEAGGGGGEAAGRSRAAWLQQQRELAGSAVAKKWEAFKSQNPQTVLQARPCGAPSWMSDSGPPSSPCMRVHVQALLLFVEELKYGGLLPELPRCASALHVRTVRHAS